MLIECVLLAQNYPYLPKKVFFVCVFSRWAVLATFRPKITDSDTTFCLHFLSRNLFVISQFGRGPIKTVKRRAIQIDLLWHHHLWCASWWSSVTLLLIKHFLCMSAGVLQNRYSDLTDRMLMLCLWNVLLNIYLKFYVILLAGCLQVKSLHYWWLFIVCSTELTKCRLQKTNIFSLCSPIFLAAEVSVL